MEEAKKPNSLKTMEEIINELTECELAQQKIYDVYRKAADADVEMRKLKSDERVLRYLIASRVYSCLTLII